MDHDGGDAIGILTYTDRFFHTFLKDTDMKRL